jgi:F-type H+-transporting ATPase subunit b
MRARMWIGIGIALAVIAPAVPAAAQSESKPAEPAGIEHAEKGLPPTAGGTHGEQHGAGHADPSKHFNFVGREPGQLFDYKGKDAYGGKLGDGKMVDPQTGTTTSDEEPASPPFIFAVLNFVLLLALLAWKGRPAVRKVAADRHDMIKSALDEAAELRKQAADKLAQYEARLKEADAQIKALVEGMRADAKKEEERILAAAETQAAMMKRDAELRIAAEIELARVQLTREVTAAAIAAAEKLLRDKMTPADQQQLVGGFIAGITGAPGAGPAGAGPAGKGVR